MELKFNKMEILAHKQTETERQDRKIFWRCGEGGGNKKEKIEPQKAIMKKK